MTRTVTVSNRVVAAVNNQAKSAYPEECCGFLYGCETSERVEVVVARAFENQRTEERTRRYLITPEQYMEGEEFAERSGNQLVGIFHSHPDHPAVPSQYDLEMGLPGLVYLIVGVQGGLVVDAKWWELPPDRSAFMEVTPVRNNIRKVHS